MLTQKKRCLRKPDSTIPELKPCPFCGNGMIEVESESNFSQLQGRGGCAVFHLRCGACGTDKWEYTWGVKDYNERFKVTVEKWNRRV